MTVDEGRGRGEKRESQARDYAQSIVNWGENYHPCLNSLGLAFLCMNQAVYPHQLEQALETALDNGVLSLAKEGNFLVCARGYESYPLNPEFKGKLCYIVNEDSAYRFQEKLKCPAKISIIQNGEYPIKLPISPQGWKAIHAKIYTSEGIKILENLVEMGVLTLDESKGIVVKTDGVRDNKSVVLNIELSPKTVYYFVTETDAYNFGESFHPKLRSSELVVSKARTL